MLTIKITITPLPIIIGILFKKLNYEIGTAYNIGNMGMLYETGDDNESD
jgi:hypothetical protein